MASGLFWQERVCTPCPGREKVTLGLSLPSSVPVPGPRACWGSREPWPQGAWGEGGGGPVHRGEREVGFIAAFHMVGFTINFECLCGSIKFPMVVYREYESRKLVAKTG